MKPEDYRGLETMESLARKGLLRNLQGKILSVEEFKAERAGLTRVTITVDEPFGLKRLNKIINHPSNEAQ